jgi:hypothetical protein
MELKFHTDAAITNGVLLNASNIGQWVEWRATLRNLSTGNVHRTVMCGGYYTGSFVEPQTGWLYAQFEHGKIGDLYQHELGLPVAFFRHES